LPGASEHLALIDREMSAGESAEVLHHQFGSDGINEIFEEHAQRAALPLLGEQRQAEG
jgi:hypothetical protein